MKSILQVAFVIAAGIAGLHIGNLLFNQGATRWAAMQPPPPVPQTQ